MNPLVGEKIKAYFSIRYSSVSGLFQYKGNTNSGDGIYIMVTICQIFIRKEIQ